MKIHVKTKGDITHIMQRSHPGSSSYVLRAVNFPSYFGGVVHPKMKSFVGTGLIFDIPDGYEAFIRQDIDLLHTGLELMNFLTPIEADNDKEVTVCLHNWTDVSITLEKGQVIAHIVFQKVEHPVFLPK